MNDKQYSLFYSKCVSLKNQLGFEDKAVAEMFIFNMSIKLTSQSYSIIIFNGYHRHLNLNCSENSCWIHSYSGITSLDADIFWSIEIILLS